MSAKRLLIICMFMVFTMMVGCENNQSGKESASTNEVSSDNPTDDKEKQTNQPKEETREEVINRLETSQKSFPKVDDKINKDLQTIIDKVEVLDSAVNGQSVTDGELQQIVLASSYVMNNFPQDSNEYIFADSMLKIAKIIYVGKLQEEKDTLVDAMNQVRTIAEDSGFTVTEENKEQNEPVKKDIKKLTQYKSGKHKAGTDMPAGEYVIYAKQGYGYFAITSDSNGDDIIANENFSFNSIIYVNDGEFLELSNSYAVPIEEVSNIPLNQGTMFKVGTFLPAGEYKLSVGTDMGYYCVYGDDRQQDIVSNENFENQTYVTVEDGQYLLLSNCKIEQ